MCVRLMSCAPDDAPSPRACGCQHAALADRLGLCLPAVPACPRASARRQVVNGPDHPGAVGPPPAKHTPPPPRVPAELAGKPLRGWREVYLSQGAAGWAKAVREHKGVLLTDTTM